MANLPWPSDISYGRIIGQFAYMDGDMEDKDTTPDMVPAMGTVTITPSVNQVKYNGVEGPKILVPRKILGKLDANGYLVGPDGKQGIVVPSTSNSVLNPSGWTYAVSINITDGGTINLDISLEPGEEKDITTAVPIPASGGTVRIIDESTALRAEAAASSVFNIVSEIRDDLFRYEGISVEDTSDESASKGEVNPGDPDAEAGEAEPERTEEALYDTSSFQKGKVTLCVNRGTVEADTNVGGIVGQVATEYDFDPEDDITLTGTESFDVEQTIKAVVRDSRNFGDITGKKDNVGGIVGKAEYGAIISCESYAPIESNGGSDVGGIAGSASYAIRSCYSMGRITGKNNIGGIAGEGCDIFYSYAYNDLDMSGENQGSIAGKVSDDGSLYGNYYVEGGVGGVDGIGYQGGATPLSYQELCAKDGVPEAFSQFTITFLADGEEVASYKCNYGDYLSADQIPEVPEKEGYYGVWPDYDFSYITGNRVLEAEYEEWTASIASAEKNDANKPLVMAEGNFYPNAALHLQIEGDTYKVSMTNSMKEDAPDYTGEATLRVYCEDADNTVVWVEQDGEYREVESTVIGSYRQFTMEVPGSFRIAEAESSHTRMIVMCIIGVAVGILLIVLLVKKVAKRREKRRQEKAEHAGQADDTEGQL